MDDKVYFIHGSNLIIFGENIFGADFFVKKELADQYGEGWADYIVEDCPYVKAFLKEHPDYVYVGSTDNGHPSGWGMDFEDFTEVKRPKIDNDYDDDDDDDFEDDGKDDEYDEYDGDEGDEYEV